MWYAALRLGAVLYYFLFIYWMTFYGNNDCPYHFGELEMLKSGQLLQFLKIFLIPANKYILKVNNRKIRKRCEIRITIKTSERRQWGHSDVLMLNIFHNSLSVSIINYEKVNVSWMPRASQNIMFDHCFNPCSCWLLMYSRNCVMWCIFALSRHYVTLISKNGFTVM